jgi:hypothetical protein
MEACPCDAHERQRDEEDDRHKDSPYQFRHVNSHLVVARLSGDRSYHPTTALQEFSTWVPPYGGVCTHNLPNLDPIHSFRSQPRSTALVGYGIRNAQRHQPHLYTFWKTSARCRLVVRQRSGRSCRVGQGDTHRTYPKYLVPRGGLSHAAWLAS